MTLRPVLLALLLACALAVGPAAARTQSHFTPEPTLGLQHGAVPPPVSRGWTAPRSGRAPSDRAASKLPARGSRAADQTPLALLADTYVQDGMGSAVTLNPVLPTNAIVAFNEGWDFDPDIPMSGSTGGSTWWAAAFPVGTGIYGGYPHTPWSQAGNLTNEFFVSLAREDLYPTDNTHTVLARSTDSGHGFTRFYEIPGDVRQDRPMFDVDRPTERGGQTGAHDGKLYLCFDDFGPGGSGYAASYIDVLTSGGSLESQVQVSAPGANFRGSQFQPLAGIFDGQIYMVSASLTNGGATANATFHEFTGAGTLLKTYSKSTISWAPAGQRLGTSTHWGVNGHRIDEHGYLDVDRSNGPRRGYLYFITNRNPNPSDPTKDQGDLYLSVSFTRGSTWQTTLIPTYEYHTQYFPMMDVDDQGWIHVAYYENVDGDPNNGVLTASRAAVFYTVSRDGGTSWTEPVRVNSAANDLSLEDPPLELGGSDYNLLGDYMQLQATGTGDATSVLVGWTGYNQYRSDDGVGTKKQRVYVTRVAATPAPGASPGSLAALAAALVSLSALVVARRRRSIAD